MASEHSSWAKAAGAVPPLRVVCWDLETAPLIAATWGMFKQNIGISQIHRDSYIICGAWRVLGQKKVHSAAINPEDAARYMRDGGEPPDREVVQTIRDAIQAADIIVAHNGDKFDLRKLGARVIMHGLEPLPSVRTVDTLKEARKVAMFDSGRLDYLSRRLLEDGGKIKTDMSLWMQTIQGDPAALKRMLRYCRRDVTELERVYQRLRPYMKSHPNVAVRHSPSGVLECPRCGGTGLTRDGMHRAQVLSYARFRCDSCGSWSRASKSGAREEDDYGLLRPIGGRHA